MTTQELRTVLYEKNYPITFEVDAQTYALVCQEVFNHAVENQIVEVFDENVFLIKTAIGPKNGILFKGVELILKDGV